MTLSCRFPNLKEREGLVLVDTALLAKEKGFNWGCTYYIKNFESNELLKTAKYCRNARYQLVLPSQALLDKWLREKYKIYISINTSGEHKHTYLLRRKNKIYTGVLNHNTYEKAYELALVKGLKLIK